MLAAPPGFGRPRLRWGVTGPGARLRVRRVPSGKAPGRCWLRGNRKINVRVAIAAVIHVPASFKPGFVQAESLTSDVVVRSFVTSESRLPTSVKRV